MPGAPRYAAAWAASLYVLCALALGYPALGGRFLVSSHSDQYLAGFPFREFGATVLQQTGGFPLWNPYLMSGVPFVAGMGGDIFYPTFILRLVLPTDVAMTWSFILHLFLCGIFCYGFLRAWGFRFHGALLGGVAYMLSGQIASLVSPGHDGKLYVSAMLPLALWMLVLGVRDGRLWSWGVFAFAVGLGVLSPHPQLLQYMLLMCGAFALYLAFASHDGVRLERQDAFIRLALAMVAVIVGGAMGAVQFLPVQEYVGWSPRAGGRGYEYSTSFSMPPEEFINLYLPQFSGIIDAYWGRNSLKLHSEYVGVVVLILASAGIMWRRGTRHSGFRWFWVGTLIVSALWALGGYTPFFRLVYAIVPGTPFFRAPSTIYFVTAFALSVLAAMGTQRALEAGVGRGFLLGWGGAAVLIALLATAGLFTNLAATIAHPQLYGAVIDNRGAVVLGAWRSLLFAGLALLCLAALGGDRLKPAAAGWALAGLAALDLWSVQRLYWRFSPPAEQLYASDAALDLIREQTRTEPGRVLTAEMRGVGELAPRDPVLAGSALMHHELRAVLGYHGNELGRYQLIGAKDEGWRNVFHPRFWSLYNVRYLLTNLPEAEGFERLIGPVRNAAGSVVYLYRLPGNNPAAWVAPVIVQAADDAVLATLLDPRFDDVRRAALFAPEAPITPGPALSQLPSALPIGVNISRYDPGAIDLRLDAPAPAGSALVVSENFYPGWRATSGGTSLPTGRVNFTLIGVELPEGAQEVSLRFESSTYRAGRTVTVLALLIAMAAIAGGLLYERRRRD